MNNLGLGYLGANQGFGYLTADGNDFPTLTLSMSASNNVNVPDDGTSNTDGHLSHGQFSYLFQLTIVVGNASATNTSITVGISCNNGCRVESTSLGDANNPTEVDVDSGGFSFSWNGSTQQLTISKTAALAPGTYHVQFNCWIKNASSNPSHLPNAWSTVTSTVTSATCDGAAGNTPSNTSYLTQYTLHFSWGREVTFASSYNTSSAMTSGLTIYNASSDPGTSGIGNHITSLSYSYRVPNCTSISTTDSYAVGYGFTLIGDSVLCQTGTLATPLVADSTGVNTAAHADIDIHCTAPGSAQTIDPVAGAAGGSGGSGGTAINFVGSLGDGYTLSDVFNGNITISAAPSWTTDATSGIAIPQNATEWANFISAKGLSISAPDSLRLCQDASGNLADAIGATALVASGTIAYQQVVSGWSSKAVKFTDGAVGKAEASTPSGYSTSVFEFALVSFPTAPSTNRVIFGPNPNGSTTGGMYIGQTTGGSIIVRDDANSANGTGTYSSGVHPCGYKLDRTNSACRAYTDLEKVTVTYKAPTGSLSGLGLGRTDGGAADSAAGVLYEGVWSGANAEAFTDAEAKSFYQGLGYTITWT